MRRPAAVAGRFYPARPPQLVQALENYIEPSSAPRRAFGCLVPHAGIMYSGHVAGAVYGRLEPASSYIILCPNHSGVGASLAVNLSGEWETPLGSVPVDADLAAALQKAYPALEDDEQAHRYEHSLEVQLPFLQHRQKEFRFVPLALGVSRYEPMEELGHALAGVIRQAREPVLLIASSDLNHYDPEEINRAKDQRVIEQLLEINPRGLYDTVRGERITMCGYGPGVSLLVAARDLGVNRAELIRYAHSGEVTGDRSAVVGYAGIVFWQD